MEFQNKIALVTGASRGIGRAVALGLAKEGAHIVALARTKGALEELDDEIKEIGADATLVPLNLLKLDEIDKLGPSIYERFGKLDILIGNAGIMGPLTPLHQIDPKEWDKVMNLNFHANLRLIRTLDPLLRNSMAGRLVFTTSGASQRFDAYRGPYTASKAALEAAVKIYAGETQQTNIKANLINPGFVDTRLLTEAYPGGYQGETKKPEDVVPAFLGLCSESCNHSGDVILV